jgi:hypothetical protein
MQPVPIATNVVSSNPVDGGVYSIQYLRNNSTGDADNSSNKVLLFLFLWNPPNVYTLVCKHTNKWINISTFQIPSAKKIVM